MKNIYFGETSNRDWLNITVPKKFDKEKSERFCLNFRTIQHN